MSNPSEHPCHCVGSDRGYLTGWYSIVTDLEVTGYNPLQTRMCTVQKGTGKCKMGCK